MITRLLRFLQDICRHLDLTLFLVGKSWFTKITVDGDCNCKLLLNQINITKAKYFEGTVNPSNKAAINNFFKLARILDSKCEEKVLFSEEDFENDGHEAEILYTIGPIEHP